jgi:hypothetical protein
MRIEWLTIWLDFTSADAETGRRFWQQAAGDLSKPGQLRIGSADVSASRVRLGLGAANVGRALEEAIAVGGVRADAPGPPSLRSPAGFAFTIQELNPDAVTRPVVAWPDGHHSRADQLTIDVAPDAWDAETPFWRLLTGWDLGGGAAGEFARLQTPAALPVRILLQRKQEGDTSAHLDIATDNRDAEVARLERAGARRVREGARWTVLQPPVGAPVCVTDRDPATGLLAG